MSYDNVQIKMTGSLFCLVLGVTSCVCTFKMLQLLNELKKKSGCTIYWEMTLVMFLTCIWEVASSYISQDTDSPYVIHGFSQLFQANDRVLPYQSP